jgi:hypothetical protein
MGVISEGGGGWPRLGPLRCQLLPASVMRRGVVVRVRSCALVQFLRWQHDELVYNLDRCDVRASEW